MRVVVGVVMDKHGVCVMIHTVLLVAAAEYEDERMLLITNTAGAKTLPCRPP